MKNKWPNIVFSSILLIFLGSIIIYSNRPNTETTSEKVGTVNNTKKSVNKDQIVYAKAEDDGSTFEKLEENAEIIVKATKVSEENIIMDDVEGRVDDGYTLATVKINEVFNNATDLNIPETIGIYENEYYDSDRKITYHTEGYQKMQENEEYLLYLRKSMTDSFYIILGVNTGKIPLSNEVNLLQRKLQTVQTNYARQIVQMLQENAKIHKEVLKKYGRK